MNEVMEGKGFYISYNPIPGDGLSFFRGDGGSDETALVKKSCKIGSEHTHFYILNGDFRKNYKRLLKAGWRECLKFYNSKKGEFDSSWTTQH
jgi:hypothetical protein